MSPEVISQSSYSTILTVAFDLRHRLEYLSFTDRELSLFTYGFVNILYSEKRCCQYCGGHGAGHLTTRSEELNLSAYVVENGIVGRVEGECVRCGSYYLHFSCDDEIIPTLDENMRVYGLQMKFYALKVVHQELIHDMMDLILLEAMEGDTARSDGYSAIASFMVTTARSVSEMWCDPEMRDLRRRWYEQLRREALFGSDHQPLLPAQAYESYLEPYEIVAKSFVENRDIVEDALDVIKEALVDFPSEANFLMMLGVGMMYLNKFQEFLKVYSPKTFMTPNNPLYRRVKQLFISMDLSVIRRIPVVLMLYEMPRFYHYAYLRHIVEGKKVALSSEAIELCDCLVRQGRVLQHDLQKRTRKGKDELMRQQLRIRDIWLGQTELEDLPRQFVRYFSQREEAEKLPLALKALHLEERVVRLDLAQSRGAPPTIVIDCSKLPPIALLPPKPASSRIVTEPRQPLDEERKQRLESYLTKIRQKKAPDKRDPFEDDSYTVPVDPKIVEQYTGKPLEELRGGSKPEARSSGARKKQISEPSGSERQKKVEVKGSAVVEARQPSASQVKHEEGAMRVGEVAGEEELKKDDQQRVENDVGGESTERGSAAAETIPGEKVQSDGDSTSVTETGEKDGGQQLKEVEVEAPKAEDIAASEGIAASEDMPEQLQDGSEGSSNVMDREEKKEEKVLEDLGSPVVPDSPSITKETGVGGVSLDNEVKAEEVGKALGTEGEEEGDGHGREREGELLSPTATKQPLEGVADAENTCEQTSVSSEVTADPPSARPQSPVGARRKTGRSCARCNEAPEKLQRCKGCKMVYYCNAECQRLHWKVHKAECRKQ